MAKAINLIGQRFKNLVAIELVRGRNKDQISVKSYLCSCDCGNTSIVPSSALRSGNTGSCGCRLNSKTHKHGMHDSKEYQTYVDMLQRCLNPKHKSYLRYGGAGIGVCDDWNKKMGGSFDNFYRDMGDRPDGMSLDREDNSKGYSPDNCRWATPKEQARNRGLIKANKSGVNGIQWKYDKRKTKYVVAEWRSLLGKSESKWFNADKLGEELAFFMACEYREQMINLLNLQGAGYSENHGK